MTRNEILYKQRDQIMDTFDFAKVAKVMQFLDWEWAFTNGVPEEWEIRQQARNLMNSVIESTDYTTSFSGSTYFLATGGFKVTYAEGVEDKKPWVRLDLIFELEDSINDGQFFEPSILEKFRFNLLPKKYMEDPQPSNQAHYKSSTDKKDVVRVMR
jgi:hypothetical protein